MSSYLRAVLENDSQTFRPSTSHDDQNDKSESDDEEPSDEEPEPVSIPPLPEVPDRCGPPTIPLNVLLDFAIQHVYHEITVLAELMQRKSGDQNDQEKKISLVNFAHATRTQFVKLVALVRWIRTSKRLEVCNAINYLLDLQSQLYVDSADRLVAMTRGDLVLARLPEYQILPAIDVLTIGTYLRMPTKIKDAFISPSKITPREQTMVLARLNQLIECRISRMSTNLSPRFSSIVIKNGMAIFTVPGEFEIKVTLLGETEKTKWTLLNIKILVVDYELGLGMPLVHSLQLNQLHGVLQTRMNVSKEPINEAFHFLHNFCVSLQLDVLFCQTSRLVAGRLRDNILIEKYDPKERNLIVGYWVKRSINKKMTLGSAKSEAQYRVQIFEDKDDKTAGLKVRHFPHAPFLGKLDCRTGKLSMEQLLSETYIVRCRERLLRIRRIIESADPTMLISLDGNVLPSLSICLFPTSDSMEERLQITVNSFCGKILCDIHLLDRHQTLSEFGQALHNGCSLPTVRKYLEKMRLLISIERYRRSIRSLPVCEKKEYEISPFLKDLRLPEHRMFLQFTKFETYYLVVIFEPLPIKDVKIELKLLQIDKEIAQFINLDLFSRMQKTLDGAVYDTMRNGSYKYPQSSQYIASAVSLIDERLSYLFVEEELNKRNIKTELTVVDDIAPSGLCLMITDISSVIPFDVSSFFKCCVRNCLRIDNRIRVMFQFEMCFENIPLVRDVPHGLPKRRRGVSNNEDNKDITWIQEICRVNNTPMLAVTIVDTIIHRFTRYLHMYKVIHNFSIAYNAYYKDFCSIEAYTFHKLVLSYGEKRDQLMIIAFNPKSQTPEGALEDSYFINFGQSIPHSQFLSKTVDWRLKPRWNPHAMLTQSLRDRLRDTGDLVWIVNYLIETTKPLQYLANFGRIRFLSAKPLSHLLNHDVHFPFRLKYQLTAINETTLRLLMGSLILEFVLLSNQKIAVRDCSRFRPKCAGLHRFFFCMSGNNAPIYLSKFGEYVTDVERPSAYLAENTREIPVSQHSHANGSGMSNEWDLDSEEMNSMNCSTIPIVVSHQTIIDVCDFQLKNNGIMTSILNDYLEALVYLERAKAAVDRLTQRALPKLATNATFGGIVEVLNTKPDLIKFRAAQLNSEGLQCTQMVYYTIYVCPEFFRCRIKIEFDEGSNPAASEENIMLMCEYFERIVFRSYNELALQSFILLTRITSFGGTASIAHLMGTQMDSNASPFVQISLSHKNTATKKYGQTCVVDQTYSNVLIVVLISSTKQMEDINCLRFVYNLQDNFVRPETMLELEGFQQLVMNVNNEVKANGECAIGFFVKSVVERFVAGTWRGDDTNTSFGSLMTSTNLGSTAGPMSVENSGGQYLQRPTSVQMSGGPPSHQMNPSSVGHPTSVGPASVGYPGSVGHSIGHGPASVGPSSVGPSSVGYPGSVGQMVMNPPSVGPPMPPQQH